MADFPKETFGAGEVIFHKGEPADSFYMVSSGSVEIFDPDQKTTIAMLGGGSSFGEQSLLVGGVRGASARARIPTECTVVGTARLREALHQEKSLLRQGVEGILLQLAMHNEMLMKFRAGKQPTFQVSPNIAELAAANSPRKAEIFLNNPFGSRPTTPEILLLRLIASAQLAAITFGEGQLIIRGGDHPQEAFFVLQGEVNLSTPELGLCVLGPGSVVSLAEGVAGVPSRAKAVAKTQTLTMRLPLKPLLNALANANPGLKGIMRVTMLRILDLYAIPDPPSRA